MTLYIRVDDKTKEGRSLIEIAQSLARHGTRVKVLSQEQLEQMEDQAVGIAIQSKRTGKSVSRERIMKILQS